jgi:hypothetical protein
MATDVPTRGDIQRGMTVRVELGSGVTGRVKEARPEEP